jgi:hypothetical protein
MSVEVIVAADVFETAIVAVHGKLSLAMQREQRATDGYHCLQSCQFYCEPNNGVRGAWLSVGLRIASLQFVFQSNAAM